MCHQVVLVQNVKFQTANVLIFNVHINVILWTTGSGSVWVEEEEEEDFA